MGVVGTNARRKEGPEKLCGLAQYIDHTLLKPDVPPEKIDTLCDEAMEYGLVDKVLERQAEPKNGES